MARHTRLLLRLFWQPAGAMSDILDQGSLLYASLAALASSLLLAGSLSLPAFRFYTPLLVLALAYVPGTLLLGKLIAGLHGSLGSVLQRDYPPLLTCTAMAWSAAALPLAIASWLLPASLSPVLTAPAVLYFAFLMFFAARTVFGCGNAASLGVVALSWIPLVAVAFFWAPLEYLMGWLASPFFLFYAYYYLGGEIGNLGSALRGRQSYRRMLEAAAVNPHDGEAQYELGLIYQERRQYTEAIRRFENAVRIDPQETGAHFQLGRIAIEQGRLDDAIRHFETVLAQDPKHGQYEILRELGAAYLSAGRLEEARFRLADYVERRAYDPEGLYHYGRVLEQSGLTEEARAAYEQAVETAQTAPRYRRRFTAKWSRLAQKRLRKLSS